MRKSSLLVTLLLVVGCTAVLVLDSCTKKQQPAKRRDAEPSGHDQRDEPCFLVQLDECLGDA